MSNSIKVGRSAKTVGKRHYASYYSGTDIRIYLGDLWVDEIVEIEWTLQEQLAPIFGFSSYTWDKVARGNRFVTGSFSINFKEAGYLQTILNSLSSSENINKEWFSLKEFNGSKGSEAHKNVSVENIINNFDDLAQDYENALWGTTSASGNLLDSRRSDTFFYGTDVNPDNKALKEHGFNILITYGESPDPSRSSNSFETAQTIVGVQITGVSSRVDPSGNPVSEVYTFIAKDISGNVQKSY
ncbi:hypothetical protein [Bacillus subtilis]|uniref:hypothetical protein n=1 Tax=Bacillus subtilis TaxID=1423 RepID=UPI0021D997E7|nr:hypothetical protein [Bacillus subtilis]